MFDVFFKPKMTFISKILPKFDLQWKNPEMLLNQLTLSLISPCDIMTLTTSLLFLRFLQIYYMYIKLFTRGRGSALRPGLHQEGFGSRGSLHPGEGYTKRVYLKGGVCRRVCLQGALYQRGLPTGVVVGWPDTLPDSEKGAVRILL